MANVGKYCVIRSTGAWIRLSRITNCDLSLCLRIEIAFGLVGRGHTDSSCVELCREDRMQRTAIYNDLQQTSTINGLPIA